MVLLAFILPSAFAAQQPDTPILPTVSFYNLNKARVTLPADLPGMRNMLLLYFELSQQADVDQWTETIDRWRAADPSLGAVTSLVSPQKNVLARWWQNASLRSAAPSAKDWSTTLPLYVDKKAFLKALEIGSEKQVVVLLLDRQGHVLGRVTGAPTPESRAAMKTAIAAHATPNLTPAPQPK